MRKRVPMAMPARAVRERRDETATVEEAARAEHRDLHRRDDLRQEEGGGHGAGVAAALRGPGDHRVHAPLGDLLRVALRADRGHRHDAGRPSGA